MVAGGRPSLSCACSQTVRLRSSENNKNSFTLVFFLFLAQSPHDVSDPGGCKTNIFKQLLSVLSIQPTAKLSNNLFIHMLPPQVPERLDDQSADPTCRRHVPWRGLLQYDMFLSDLYGSGTAISKVYDLHGNLGGKPKEVSRIGA